MQLPGFGGESTLNPAASYVYVGSRGGQLKIGTTCSPHRRAHELGLTMLRVIPGDRSDERMLHTRFRHARIDREWFLPSADLLSWVVNLQ